MKLFWLATVAKRISFSLATNGFVEPQHMFLKGIDTIKFGSKDSKQNAYIYLIKFLLTTEIRQPGIHVYI